MVQEASAKLVLNFMVAGKKSELIGDNDKMTQEVASDEEWYSALGVTNTASSRSQFKRAREQRSFRFIDI